MPAAGYRAGAAEDTDTQRASRTLTRQGASLPALVLATADDPLRASLVEELAREGLPCAVAPTWSALLGAVVAPDTRLVLVDPALPALDAPLLAALAEGLDHRPRLRRLGGTGPAELPRLAATPRAVLGLARRMLGPAGLGPEERRQLRWLGLGADPLPVVARLAAVDLPLLFLGEPGTGKERVARAVHRFERPGAPFVTVPAGGRWERREGVGTVYLESLRGRDPRELRAFARELGAAGWRLMAGSRGGEAPPGVTWHVVPLPPLRERPGELVELARHYLDEHSRRLGLGRRAFDKAFVAELQSWRWPQNHRELEGFVVAALTTLPGPTLRGADLPDALRGRLRPAEDDPRSAVGGFEELAEQRLRPVVASYTPGGTQTLHDLVVGSVEKVLITLALARTGGNRKAAAALLGVARNTLQARIEALGIATEAP